MYLATVLRSTSGQITSPGTASLTAPAMCMVLSYVDENGKRVTPTKSTGLPVKGNKKRAEALLNDWRKSEEIAIERRKASGTLKKPDSSQDIMFTQFMLDWLDMMRNSVEITTYASYVQNIKSKINPYFDAKFPTLTLSKLTPKHIQDYYTWEMRENGLTANTVIHRHANIRKALQYAFKTGLIDVNPADRIERPRKESFVGSTYNDQELEQFKKRKYQYMAKDKEGRDVFLADSGYVLSMAQEDFKHIKFHFTSEF